MAIYLTGLIVVGAWLSTVSMSDPTNAAYFQARGLEAWSVRAGVAMLALVWPLALVLLARQALRRG
jgi:hypothetical protein